MRKNIQIIPYSVMENRFRTNEKKADFLLKSERKGFDRKIIVLDDDPTGVQTVHDVTVFTEWDKETIRQGFLESNSLFYILTNSRSFSCVETTKIHKEIAESICEIAEECGKKFIIVSRSDSTLRGHFPLETDTLAEQIEESQKMTIDGEILCPFFSEGGRFTMNNIHYVKEGQELIPAAMTEFAKDSMFGYETSNLCDYVEEKTKGKYRAADCVTISLEELNAYDIEGICRKLNKVYDFQKVIVNAVCYSDLKVFTAALMCAIKNGKEFIIRSAASLPKILGGIEEQPLLDKKQLVGKCKNGGIVLIGSHVRKTTAQLEELKKTDKDVVFTEFDVHACFDRAFMETEITRIVNFVEQRIIHGQSVVIYTSRALLAPENLNAEEKLRVSVQISASITDIISRLHVRPGFLIAKGGITSSDVGKKALHVKRAKVMGQIQKGIPVWMTGQESKFPGIPYIIFPGNVGEISTLKEVVEELL